MTSEKENEEMMHDSKEVLKTSYEKPSLLNLGELTSLTMGSRPGIGESGQAGQRRNPT